MGRVQQYFTNGVPGAVTRAVDEIIISVRNASEEDIPFGAPVFLDGDGAVPFSLSSPQEFSAFLGFAVRVADKTPDEYPWGSGAQNPEQFSQQAAWHPGDVMEVLVRGALCVRTAAAANLGDPVYIRKTDGKLTSIAGSAGTSVQLENVHVRARRDALTNTTEVVVTERNIL